MSSFRIFFTALLVWVCFSASSFAQTNGLPAFDTAEFEATAERAEDVIRTDQASSDALEQLRTTLSGLRSRALAAQEIYAGPVKTIQVQLTSLGAKPAEGQPEEDAIVAKRRADLTSQLAKSQSQLIVLQEAYTRADGLIDEIDRTIRERQSDKMLEFGPTPLNPANWSSALGAFANYLSRLGGEFFDAVSSQTRNANRLDNAPSLLLFLIIGVFLIFPARRWVSRSLERISSREPSLRRAFTSFGLSLGLFIAPMLGLAALLRAVFVADLFLLRGDTLLGYLPQMGLAIFGAAWIARNLFYDDGPGRALLGIDTSLMQGGRRTVHGLGLVIAAGYFLNAAKESEEWSPETISVLEFPLIVLGAFGLYRLARKFRSYRIARVEQGGSTIETLSGRISTLMYKFCILIAFVGPAVAAIGYINLGSNLVSSTVLTLAMLAAVFLFYALLVNIVITLQGDPKQKMAETDTSNVGGLYKSALAFALICIAMPALALIWGARVSDISGLWLQVREGVSIGDTRFSITDVFSMILVFSIGYTITRLLQSALRSSVLPNTRIDEGAQNAIVTGIGYLGIFLAALFAIMSTGLDLSNLAIVAGALSVGIGFGLQAIVSNFVGGIILLIERPIKLGDWVEVGAHSGYVSGISVRSTSIETFDRATVIIPNADLISGTVTNWTHSNKHGRIIVPIGVGYDSDPKKVQNILHEIALAHPMVLKGQPPAVLFRGFGADSLDFELRCILRDVNFGVSTTSDINFAIVERFREEGIEIPFAQRDITIKNPQDFLQKPARTRKKPTT